ncbi:hypothetical protein HC928_01390 [bacterium]|nr:hypothetical protein [bacterium]
MDTAYTIESGVVCMTSITITRDDSETVYLAIQREHYLHRWPDPRSLPFAYRLYVDGYPPEIGNLPHGVIVFKKPQHQRQRGLFGYIGLPTHWQVLDLARVWINPALQRKQANGHASNLFSQFTSAAIRRVQWGWLDHHPPRYPDLPYHIRVIVSYCDLAHHDGTAYRASNFRWIGYTSDRTKEVYARHLRVPHKSWSPAMCDRAIQPGLPGFNMPLRYDYA